MPQDLASLGDELSGSNDEYRRLEAEHHDYDSRLTALLEKASLSEDEQIEEIMLKKKKLHLKDRMRELATRSHTHP
jgi:hypothetical protein